MAQRRLRLVEEATQVYRDFTAERSRIAQAGGALEPSPRMLELADGQFLRVMMKMLSEQQQSGERMEGSLELRNIREIPAGADELVGLAACEDASGVTTIGADGSLSKQGGFVASKVYVTQSGGVLKVVRGTGEVVDSCAL